MLPSVHLCSSDVTRSDASPYYLRIWQGGNLGLSIFCTASGPVSAESCFDGKLLADR